MEFLGIILVLAVSLVAYLIEKKYWVTVIKTTEQQQFRTVCQLLDEEGIPYRAKTKVVLDGEILQTIYKIKVVSREAERIKAPY